MVKQFLDRVDIAAILYTPLSFRSCNDDSVWVYFLCSQCDQRRSHIIYAMKGSKVSAVPLAEKMRISHTFRVD